MYVLMFSLGAIGMLVVAPLKTAVLVAAQDAPMLASTLTSSALNLGVAGGAAVGAMLIDHGAGYDALPWIGVVSATLALLAVTAFCLSRNAARAD